MKKNGIKKGTMRIAVCGIIAALSLVFMMMTSLVPIGTYALPCLAGILISCIVVEYGYGWAIGVFCVTAVLSTLLAGDKEAVIYFIALLKGAFEFKIKNRAVQYILKFAVFNVTAIGSFFVATWLLSIPTDEFTVFGFYVPWAFLIAGNIFFLLYDYAITVFVMQYVRRLIIIQRSFEKVDLNEKAKIVCPHSLHSPCGSYGSIGRCCCNNCIFG